MNRNNNSVLLQPTVRLVLFVFLLGSLATSPVEAIPLQTLFSTHGSIQQGDLLFSDFFDLSGPPSSGVSIDVQGITIGGEHGLRFSGPFSSNQTLFGGDGFSVRYNVTVLNPNRLLHDVHESFTALLTGERAFAMVPIEVFEIPTALAIAGLFPVVKQGDDPNVDIETILSSDVTKALIDERLVVQTTDLGTFPPPAGGATITSVDLTFSETQPVIPEPATWLLLGSGILGLMYFRKALR